MAKTSDPPGVIYPTKQGLLAGNPQDSAIQQSQNTSNKAASMNKLVGGKKRKHRRGGAVVAPQYANMPYTPANGAGSDPNAQIADNTQVNTQRAANAALDSGASVKGGSRKRRSTKKSRRLVKGKRTQRKKTKKRGGKMSNPDWNWKCRS